MPASKLISTALKAAPIGLIGLTLVVSFDNYYEQAEASAPPSNAAAITTLAQYNPPQNARRRQSQDTTTATRQDSCIGDANTAVTALGQGGEFLGMTASAQPQFIWHLPASEETYAIEFNLMALDEAGIPTTIYSEALTYESGFMSYQLPEAALTLSTDEEYLWQIVIKCNPSYPSRDIVRELAFEVVPPSANLSQALEAAATDEQKAALYAEAGYWYDAIAQVALSTTPAAQTARQRLLEDLANLEIANENRRENVLEIIKTLAQE